MSTRRVNVTVVRSVEYTAEVSIAEAEYLEWLDGDDDTPDAVREFLEAGSDLNDIVHDVVENGARRLCGEGITEVAFLEVRS